MRHYCLVGCSAPSVCARRLRPVRGVRAGTWCCVSPVSPFPPRASRAACGGPSRPGVPYPRSLVRHSTRSARSGSSVHLPFWWSPRALCVCVRSRPHSVRFPLPWVVWRAHLARSRHWALVGPFHVVRAPPRVLPRSIAPSDVLWGGRSLPGSPSLGLRLWGWRKAAPGGGAFHCCEGHLGSGAPPSLTARPLGGLLGSATNVPWARACRCGGSTRSPWPARPVRAACRGGGGGPSPYLACGCAPPVGRVRGVRVPRGGLGGCGGRPVRRAPRLGGRGGPVGRGVALPRSVSLPSLGRQQSRCHWRRSGHGGRGSPYHSGSCSPAFTGRDLCSVLARWRGLAYSPRFLLEPAAGAGGRAVLRLLSRAGGGGTIPPASGGGGRGPRGLRAGWGAGGGVAPRPPCSPSGWPPAVPYPGPPLVVGAVPPGVRIRLGSLGRPGGGGMRGGPWTAPPGAPSDLNSPSALPGGAMVIEGSWGVRPPYRRAPPPGLVRALLWRAGLGSPVGRNPGGNRRLGALGRAVCRSSRIPPHRVAVPSGVAGASPRLRGGGGSLLWPSSWGGGGRGGGGGPPHRPPPPRHVGRRPAIRCLRRAPPGYTRAVGVVGRPRPSGAARSAANGSVRRGRGGGGGKPLALLRAPVFPRPASEGAAPFAPSWAPPVRRRSAAGRAGPCGQFTGGACRGCGAPSPGVQRPPRGGCGAAVSSVCLRLLLGLRGRGGGGGGPLVPWRRPLTAEGGRPGGPVPGGQPLAGGLHSTPAPLYLEPDPRAGPCRGPLSRPPLSLGAGRLGAAVRVSGQRLAGCGAVGSPPRSLSPPSLPREVARAPPSRRIVGGAWVGGPSSPLYFLASAVRAVTCAAV